MCSRLAAAALLTQGRVISHGGEHVARALVTRAAARREARLRMSRWREARALVRSEGGWGECARMGGRGGRGSARGTRETVRAHGRPGGPRSARGTREAVRAWAAGEAAAPREAHERDCARAWAAGGPRLSASHERNCAPWVARGRGSAHGTSESAPWAPPGPLARHEARA